MNTFTEFKIETSNLLIRPMKESDAETIVRWRNNPDISSKRIANDSITLESHLLWFRESRFSRLDGVVEIKSTNTPIGVATFKNFDFQKKVAEAGKYIAEDQFRGKGFGKDLFEAWIDFGFQSLKLARIEIITNVTNYKNISLNEKMGFQRTGIDTFTYNNQVFLRMYLTPEKFLRKQPTNDLSEKVF